jgi:hypothetical protein
MKEIFRKHPNLSMAMFVFLVGFVATVVHFPTEKGSTTLAGALFGSGAAFIGAWVAERKKATEDAAAAARRQRTAMTFFTPELSRVIAVQVGILDRITVNFVETSIGRPPIKEDPIASFRPRKPLLYPNAAEFKDLSVEDATCLIEFYDAIHGIDEAVGEWLSTNRRIDFNTFLFFISSVRDSLVIGRQLVERFFSDKPFGSNSPASGTLLSQIQRVIANADRAKAAHLERNNPGAVWMG